MCSRLDTSKSRLTPWDRSKSQHNDPTVIKHCQNVRLTSAKLPVKFQLDCWKIKTNFPWACSHGFGSTWLAVFRDGQKTPSTYGSSFPPNDPTVIKHCQNVRLTSAKLSVKFQLSSIAERLKQISPEHVFTALINLTRSVSGWTKNS